MDGHSLWGQSLWKALPLVLLSEKTSQCWAEVDRAAAAQAWGPSGAQTWSNRMFWGRGRPGTSVGRTPMEGCLVNCSKRNHTDGMCISEHHPSNMTCFFHSEYSFSHLGVYRHRYILDSLQRASKFSPLDLPLSFEVWVGSRLFLSLASNSWAHESLLPQPPE